MEIIRNYELFKQKCTEFEERFNKLYLANNQLVCHPTIQNLIITPCSDEEARSNGLNICRMSDMMLMSDDANDWQTFVITEARQMAEQNNYVYITDLFLESAFQSEYWMINGKNDTIVVSEEYMREKGKKYAPVTPLTNKVMHFKKSINNFFWQSPSDGKLSIINKSTISKRLDQYAAQVVSHLPDIKNCTNQVFKLFNDEIEVSESSVRQNIFEKLFDIIDNICVTMLNNKDIMSYADYNFNASEYISGIFASYLQNKGVGITKEKFIKEFYTPIINENTEEKLNRLTFRSDSTEIDAIKLALIEVVEKESDIDFTYKKHDLKEYKKTLRDIETSDQDDFDIQFMISDLLRKRPLFPAIFNLIICLYPDQTENVKCIADYWNINLLTNDEVRDYIYSEYIISKNLLNEKGEFDIELEYARIIKDDLVAVTKKYKCSDTACFVELNNYIDEIDKRQRSYNGTVFENVEDMKKAMENELRLLDLCSDLSALDKSELIDLKKHISNLTIDDKTTAKYLVKIKIAMNRCEENQLALLCTGLTIKNLDQTTELKNKILSQNYEESVLKPYINKINDRIMSAQREELTELFANLEKKTISELDKLSKILNSGRYSEMFIKYYSKRLDRLSDSIAHSELEKLCAGAESLDRKELTKLKSDISALSYNSKLKNRYVKKVDSLLINFDKNEVESIFSAIDTAGNEKLDELRKIADSGKYSKILISPYIAKINEREKTLLQEKFDKICSNITTMNKEQLDTLKKDIKKEGYGADLIQKCNEAIQLREYELIKVEIDEICSNVENMNQKELDELKLKLGSNKYNEVLTAPYFDKISQRESELLSIELDEKCSKISDMTIEQLLALKEDIYAKQDFLYLSRPYFDKIDDRIEEIKKQENDKILEEISNYSKEKLNEFTNGLSVNQKEYSDGIIEMFKEAVDKRKNTLAVEEIVLLCEDLDKFDFEKSNYILESILNMGLKQSVIQPYVDSVNEHIYNLNVASLDKIIDGFENKSREELHETINSINQYNPDCSYDLRKKYIAKIQDQIKAVSDAEISNICGNIDALSNKQSFDLLRKIDLMDIEQERKNKYIDKIEAHIMAMQNDECSKYLNYLIKKMAENGITSVQFHVPSVSKVFNSKFDAVCKTYVSVGRYELPLLLHESIVGNDQEGFTLTTEFLYFKSKQNPVVKIKIEDISQFQAKKGLVSSSVYVVDKNGTTSELPNNFNKSIIESVTKILTSLVLFIHDEKATARMQEIMDLNSKAEIDNFEIKDDAFEKTVHIFAGIDDESPTESESILEEHNVEPEQTQASEAIEQIQPDEDDNQLETDNTEETGNTEVSEEVDENFMQESPVSEERKRIKFCEQCGAKVISETAKFCAECGHRLL